ncbi:MAG: head decoration protein [Deltaproteobacteria bacterium]|jgi:hypothetical protein|nr:head decoration protein [Deltaproteobacteria bacterium]
MPTDSLKKAPVLSDLLKFEQEHYLGREAALITTAPALPLGTVLEGGPLAAEPWDPTGDPEDIYGILLTPVPAGTAALGVAVLIAGPAKVNPEYLGWGSATDAEKASGLEALKRRHFIFVREPATSELYPDALNRVPD